MSKRNGDPDKTRYIIASVELPDGDVLKPFVEKPLFDPEESDSQFRLEDLPTISESTPVAQPAAVQGDSEPGIVTTNVHVQLPDSTDALEEMHLAIPLVYAMELTKLYSVRATWRVQVAVLRGQGRTRAVQMREAIIRIADERLRQVDIELAKQAAARQLDEALSHNPESVPDRLSGLRLN